MPGVFCCVNCKHVDLMDVRYPHGEDMDVDLRPLPLICTQCAGLPWHNRMNYEMYNPKIHDVVNKPSSNTTG